MARMSRTANEELLFACKMSHKCSALLINFSEWKDKEWPTSQITKSGIKTTRKKPMLPACVFPLQLHTSKAWEQVRFMNVWSNYRRNLLWKAQLEALAISKSPVKTQLQLLSTASQLLLVQRKRFFPSPIHNEYWDGKKQNDTQTFLSWISVSVH